MGSTDIILDLKSISKNAIKRILLICRLFKLVLAIDRRSFI